MGDECYGNPYLHHDPSQNCSSEGSNRSHRSRYGISGETNGILRRCDATTPGPITDPAIAYGLRRPANAAIPDGGLDIHSEAPPSLFKILLKPVHQHIPNTYTSPYMGHISEARTWRETLQSGPVGQLGLSIHTHGTIPTDALGDNTGEHNAAHYNTLKHMLQDCYTSTEKLCP